MILNKRIISLFSIFILSLSININADTRSMYIWDFANSPLSDFLDDVGTAREDLIYFCNHLPGTDDTVDTVYLSITSGTIAANLEKVRSFLSCMNSQKIKVFALNGESDWSQISNPDATNFCRDILSFSGDYSPYERFSGISLDIEDGPGFNETQLPVVLSYCRTMVSNYNNKWATDTDMILSAFIDRQVSYSARTNVINSVDWIIHEDYHDDTFNHLTKSVTNFLRFASQQNKNMRIAYETQSTNDWWSAFGTNTFWDEGWRYMETKMEKVKSVFKKYSSFKGLSIHAYHSYRRLLPPQKAAVIINNGEKYTTSATVKVELECTHASNMMISEDPSFINAQWQDFDSMFNYTFQDTISPGERTLYVKFRNTGESWYYSLESDAFSDSILIEKTGGDLSGVILCPNVVKVLDGNDPNITFKNLSVYSHVKIYNFFGELVFETYVEDGKDYTWNCKNKGNRILPSGTYLYLITNNSGSEKKGKLVIIR